MLNSQERSTGTKYTLTFTLLLMALIGPTVLFVSRPFRYGSLWLTLVVSAACLVLALFQWRCRSVLSIPSILVRTGGKRP
jgi:cell division protein FtsX